MKQISLREFSLHPTQYLKELPIILTRYNLPVAVVKSCIEGLAGALKSGSVILANNPIVELNMANMLKHPDPQEAFLLPTQPLPAGFTTNCQAPQAKCLTPTSQRYRITFKTDEGVETKEYALCEEHVKKAFKEGVRVEKI